MNFLLILIALLISGIAVLSVVALGGERAVPGAAFFRGVGRDGLGIFDRVEDVSLAGRFFGASEDEKAFEREPASGDASAAATAATTEPAEVVAPVRRGAVPLADDAESTLSAHDFVEKRKSPQVEGGASSAAEGS